MRGLTIKHFIRDVQDVFRRVESYLLSLGAERRCAMGLDRVADRLASMGAKINLMRSRMRDGGMEVAIDADCSLRDALRGLKDDIRGIRRQLAGMQTPQRSARLQRAFAHLGKIAEETYVCADRLQWEIDEHEQKLA